MVGIGKIMKQDLIHKQHEPNMSFIKNVNFKLWNVEKSCITCARPDQAQSTTHVSWLTICLITSVLTFPRRFVESLWQTTVWLVCCFDLVSYNFKWCELALQILGTAIILSFLKNDFAVLCKSFGLHQIKFSLVAEEEANPRVVEILQFVKQTSFYNFLSLSIFPHFPHLDQITTSHQFAEMFKKEWMVNK